MDEDARTHAVIMCIQVGLPTWLQLQQVTADGMAVVGLPRQLIRNDATWEGPVIEAPNLVLREVSKFPIHLSSRNEVSKGAGALAEVHRVLACYSARCFSR